jgi:CheY-like chemotaxis protein
MVTPAAKITVLLVEDSKLLKITGERLLTKAGFIVVTAQDGEEALRMVRESPPDAILLDMLLPKIGGQQVLLALKQDPVTAGIPVIILSSLSQQNEEKLKKAGATAYFEKAKMIDDVNSGKLNEAIAKAVSEARLLKPQILAASNKG